MLKSRRQEKKLRIQAPRAFRQECIVPTDEDWAPSVDLAGKCLPQEERYRKDNRFVFLSVADLRGNDTDHQSFPPYWRVVVRGGDDMGMERDFQGETAEQEAKALFELLQHCGPVNRKDLEDLAFVHF